MPPIVVPEIKDLTVPEQLKRLGQEWSEAREAYRAGKLSKDAYRRKLTDLRKRTSALRKDAERAVRGAREAMDRSWEAWKDAQAREREKGISEEERRRRKAESDRLRELHERTAEDLVERIDESFQVDRLEDSLLEELDDLDAPPEKDELAARDDGRLRIRLASVRYDGDRIGNDFVATVRLLGTETTLRPRVAHGGEAAVGRVLLARRPGRIAGATLSVDVLELERSGLHDHGRGRFRLDLRTPAPQPFVVEVAGDDRGDRGKTGRLTFTFEVSPR